MIDKPLNKGIDIAAEQLDKAKEAVEHVHDTQPARTWIAFGAVVGAVLAGAVAAWLLRDFGQRNIEYMPDMAYSKAWESQTTHDYAVDYGDYTEILPEHFVRRGTPDMPPPPGTIYRGQKTLDLPAGMDGLEQASELTNPYADAEGDELDKLLKRGEKLFIHTCQTCHGVDGVGQAPVTAYGIGAPTIANATIRDKWTDGEIFHIITHGYNTMPAHGAHVKYDDRWIVIRYLRELQKDE